MLLYREQVKQLVTNRREVRAREKLWKEEGYEKILRLLFPQGKIEAGAFRVSGDGDGGRRMSFILDTGMWTDFSEQDVQHNGLVSYLWAIEGWEGIKRLARAVALDFDFVILDGSPVREDQMHRFAMKRQLIVAGKWHYHDLDGVYLGTRVRFEDKDGEKQFRLLAYRTRKVTTDHNGRLVEMPEGWRLDGGWGALDPLYITPEDAKSDKPILLVEGEKATDAARSLVGTEYACATWGGGAAGSPKKAFWAPLEDRAKFYWPDKDAPGKKSVAKLCELDKKTRVVQVWSLGELHDKDDLADVSKWEREDKTRWVLDLLKDAPYGITPANDIVGKRYVYIVQTEQFIDLSTGARLSPMALRRAHMHEVETLDEELLSDPSVEKLASVTYWPGQDNFVLEENEMGVVVRKFNLWRDTGIEAVEGEPVMFLSHMHRLMPDDAARDHMLDYLGYMTQNPGVKILQAPLIKGKQGIGKSYLLRVMRYVLGNGNVREITTKDIVSSFNGWAESCSLIVIEEIMAIGRREITNTLKPMVTSPTTEINNKGVKTYTIPNRQNMILFSNEEVPLLLDDDDRRFFVYESPMAAEGENYYDTLFTALDDGEAAHIRWFLEKRDVSKFNPKSRAPETFSKQKMRTDSESQVMSVMRAYMDARRTPFDRDTVDLLDVVDWINGQKGVRPGEGTPKTASKYLSKLGGVRGEDMVEGNQVKQVFIIRNHKNYLPDIAS